MPRNLATLAARCAGRPILMEPRALRAYVDRIRDVDARAFDRPGRLEAFFRKITNPRPSPVAMDDDDFSPPPALHQRLAYAPRYIGEPDDTGYCWSLKNGVALMCVNTPLLDEGEDYCGTVYHGYDTLLNGMSEAAADDRVKAIWIKMKTPGGIASPGIMALSAWMRANRAAAGGKPIWVYAEQATSAGIWIAAQADRIDSPAMGYLGSVGAYTLHEDDTGMLDKLGVVITEIKFGAKKTDGAWWKSLSDSAKADIQAEIDQLGENFLADMIAGRPKLTRDALLATQAACYFAQTTDPARSGLELGFCDAIRTEEESFAALLEAISSPAIPNIPVATPAGGAKTKSTAKEQPMAKTAEEKAAARAALVEEQKRLTQAGQSNAAALAAVNAKLEKGDDDEEDEDEGEEEDQPEDGTKPAEDDDEDQDEAQKISASAEAKDHPHLALAAIESNQTLAQFQATVKAQANAPKRGGALADAMRDTPRLNNDPSKPSATSDLNPQSIYASRKPGAGK